MSGFEGDLVGRTLNRRYRLLALLGTGSSARVYLAHDVHVARQVAVKVLHASLAEDPEFLRRFRVEAEALGQLDHANIVTVHDFNDGANALGEPPYLVTNYLSGGSLRNLLDQGYRLTPSQAARMALDAASGLAFAHARGYIHRDVKPANLLFTEQQRAHIADFGLARAKAEAARTEASGAPIGTMRYLAPEQVGGDATDRSDVYALALVVVESITGVVPFSRDNWQGTAFARTKEDLRAPEILGELGPIIDAAGVRDPAQRIDAATFAERIEDVARRLPKAEPLPLDGARILARGALLDGRDPTRLSGEIAPRPRSAVALDDNGEPRSVFDQALFEDETIPPASRSGAAGADDADDVKPDRPAPRRIDRSAADEPERRSILPRILAGIGIVALLAAVIGGISWARRPEMRDVPSVEGLMGTAAKAKIEAEKLVVVEDDPVFDDAVTVGAVVRQEPPAPRRLKKGSIVTITLSKGRQPVEVPDLSGLTLDQATAVLRSARLGLSSPVRFEASETVPDGNVISWTPRGAQQPDTVVNVVVSSGPANVVLPETKGMKPDDAIAAMPSKLTVTTVETYSDSTPKGAVIGTKPKAGEEVPADSEVQLLVSIGPSSVVVPNVINMSPADASAALRAAGLKIGSTIGPADLPVLHTRPVRRTTVKRGTVVTLFTTEDGVPPLPADLVQAAPSGKPSGSTTKPASTKPATTDAPSPSTKKPTATTKKP